MHNPDAFLPITQGFSWWIIALVLISLVLRCAGKMMAEEIPGRFSCKSSHPCYMPGTRWGKPVETIASIMGKIFTSVAVSGASNRVSEVQKKTNRNEGLISA